MYILRELAAHKWAYILLLLVLLAHGAGYFYWADTRIQQQAIIVSLTISYLVWGVVAHVKSAEITKFVVLEYLGIATLGGLLLLLLTF
jgi:hypothetical protein